MHWHFFRSDNGQSYWRVLATLPPGYRDGMLFGVHQLADASLWHVTTPVQFIFLAHALSCWF
jgi:hypothetical protein